MRVKTPQLRVYLYLYSWSVFSNLMAIATGKNTRDKKEGKLVTIGQIPARHVEGPDLRTFWSGVAEARLLLSLDNPPALCAQLNWLI